MARERVLVIDKGERERERESGPLYVQGTRITTKEYVYITLPRRRALETFSRRPRSLPRIYMCVCAIAHVLYVYTLYKESARV